MRTVGLPGGVGRDVESRSNLRHESGEVGFVEDLRGVLLKVVAEAVIIVVHPRKQAGRGIVRIRAFRLAGPDPAAIQVADELAEAPARIIELFDLGVARGEERLVQGNRP